MDLKLNGKRALICGGSSGLGRAVATALVAEGAHVALLSRDEGKLQAVAAALNASGPGKAVVVTADLADHEALLKAVDRAEDLLGGPVEILLNNTGGRRRRACRGWSRRCGAIISSRWCCRFSA